MSLSPWSQKDLDENAQLLNIRPKKIDFKMLKDMVRRGSNSVTNWTKIGFCYPYLCKGLVKVPKKPSAIYPQEVRGTLN
jgi:hypothetical protein